MEEYRVRDLMIPLSEYATVSEDATLLEAVQALEKAQHEFDTTHYRHRVVLVLDGEGAVTGKLNQLDILRALEPRYEKMESHKGMSRYGFSKDFIELTLEENGLWDTPLEHICQKVVRRTVREFMHVPDDEECVEEETSLDSALHQLIVGRHQLLLVTKGEDFTGILRLYDMFAGVFQLIKECRV